MMKRIWKTLGVVVLVVILLGAICAGIGIVTGAEMSRIYSVLDAQYNITEYVDIFSQISSGLL